MLQVINGFDIDVRFQSQIMHHLVPSYLEMPSVLANVIPGVTILATVPIGWNTSKFEVCADTVPDSFPCAVVCISSKLKCHESCVADPRSGESDSESSAIGETSL